MENFWNKVKEIGYNKSRVSSILLILDEFEDKLLVKNFEYCKHLLIHCPYAELSIEQLMGILTVLNPWKQYFTVERQIAKNEAYKKARLKYSEEECEDLLNNE